MKIDAKPENGGAMPLRIARIRQQLGVSWSMAKSIADLAFGDDLQ